MTPISDFDVDRPTRHAVRRTQSHVDALSIGVAAIGSVVQGRPCDIRQWALAQRVWAPAMRRYEADCGQIDALVHADPDIGKVLLHTLQRSQFADDLITSFDPDLALDDDHRIITRDALQRLASSCFVSRNILGRIGYRLDDPAVRNQDVTIDHFLRAVAAGQAPCLDPSGALVIPGWAERRRHERAVLNDRIELRWRDVHRITYVINRTAFGLGIVAVEGLVPDMVIDVTLMDGPTVQARVVWIASGRAGLELIRRD